MLRSLSIRNVVLIEKLDLILDSGMTVLTGETGAGKSILLDSLGLVIGERATISLIRNGTSQASVRAEFRLPRNDRLCDLLDEHGLSQNDKDYTIYLRRTLGSDGRSRAYINDQSVSLAELRQVGKKLIAIQGQHAQIELISPAAHRNILDEFGVNTKIRREISRLYNEWQHISAELSKARNAIHTAQDEQEWLRQSLEELRSLSPQRDEEQRLADLRQRLQENERHAQAIAEVTTCLSSSDQGSLPPSEALRNASRILRRLASAEIGCRYLHEALETVTQAEDALAQTETLLSRFMADLDTDQVLLEQTEERLFALRRLARKYNVPVTELPQLIEDMAQKLTLLDSQRIQVKNLERAVQDSLSHFVQRSQNLTSQRIQAAEQLQQAIMEELGPLKMDKARFIVEIVPLSQEKWSYHGQEEVNFLFTANPGQPPSSLEKVASGGELSRLMLAFRVVLAKQFPVPTLIFDEIDVGVDGATAAAIGVRLHHIAKTTQVLVVTHSPQIAAKGNHHFHISKKIHAGNTTHTYAELLMQSSRCEEIARMLSGGPITNVVRAVADSLLKNNRYD